ncbi:DNA gyrase subunit A [Phycisphaera mikurensis]|uniref:DNA topoisomerase (ATP-hydrolyzing) n=1 Tax=Phycisphaera mikurensis (strain NBRC 102666 / KCTC 22515 / FYK2301M01) TaxID=1142394 RepID=I0IBH7_PHYMF|nr:DNA gyrase subunit A [Phycisphaera mikurensis]MBB6442854.1 DNA gyrase subunit A [Phycisphaera mikurensis]BAM02615.1 DNA gyrase subunit A [Phycisphaera mikurensis NBRC 102666]
MADDFNPEDLAPSQPPETPETPGAPGVAAVSGGGVTDLSIERELADSYLTYAMSTIVDRALPDVRDGLKPSQRRLLVSLNDLNLRPSSKHRKCAKIVGDTTGNYHPHGELSLYGALVNMGQDWKYRHTLVDPQGNFGSVDPDPPAAMRYTEARMAGPAAELLEDLKLDTVDWQPTYDDVTTEPQYLPGKFPNLLVNGGTGIAVGMATSLAPHNLGEVCDAIEAIVANPDLDTAELFQLIPGPDFPTGGILMGRGGVAQAYRTGRGRAYLRAKVHHETRGKRNLLVVTELPYQVQKNDGVVAKVKLARASGKLTEISAITDESSNRVGMRLVIELKMGADPHTVENQLYALTPLQSTFPIHSLALVRGQPRTLTLREMLDEYVGHRRDVIRRKTAYRLKQAQIEAHRIEGLIYAVLDIDEVIRLIRSSTTRDEAIEKLMARGFRIDPDHPAAPSIPDRLRAASAENEVALSRVQAEAIGRLQLIQLVGLEIEKLVADYAKLVEAIEDYEDILARPERIDGILLEDVSTMRDKYANPRRTQITDQEISGFDMGDMIAEHQAVVTITHRGYVKRIAAEEFRQQARGGRGVRGSVANAVGGAADEEQDFTTEVLVASSHDDLLCFTDTGRVFKKKVYEIPEGTRTSKGRAIVNVMNLGAEERVVEFMPIADFEKGEDFLLFSTANGLVKRTALADYRNVHSGGLIAVGLRDGDKLIGVKHVGDDDHVILGTASGMAIRFRADDARAMGRNAAGVKGIALGSGDSVVGVVRCDQDDASDLLSVTENGYGKRTPTAEYLRQSEDGETSVQGRGGKGRRDIKTTSRNGRVVTIKRVEPGDGLVCITSGGMIVRIASDDVRQTHRDSAGVRVINVKDGDKLAAVSPIKDEGEAEEAVAEEAPQA